MAMQVADELHDHHRAWQHIETTLSYSAVGHNLTLGYLWDTNCWIRTAATAKWPQLWQAVVVWAARALH
eukprot:273434-Amphidinium_carterae.1